jgi:hypothetical protein
MQMANTVLKERLSDLEQMMMELTYESMKTNMVVRDLASEMKDFKDNMNKRWGELANKMGTIVEDIVAPGLRGVARQYFGVEEFDYFSPRITMRNKDRSKTREFDLIAETEDYFFIVETKATPRTEYISDFIKFLPELGVWFPASREKKLIPIFASIYLSDQNIRYLTSNNIIAMATSEDGMDIYNKELLSKLGVKSENL